MTAMAKAVLVLALLCATAAALASAKQIPLGGARARVVRDSGVVYAGASKLDTALPIGIPLAGYNHGPRRVPHWPLPEVREYTTFMMPSTGVLDPIYAKSLCITAGKAGACFVTLDGIGSDGTMNQLAYDMAVDKGFTMPMDQIIFSSSHSHSGPGAVSAELLWALAPAVDFLVPSVQEGLAERIAESMYQAQLNMKPAKIGVGSGILTGVTRNRRADISPYVNEHSIDPHLGIIRVDNPDGTPIATLWNYATHGTCYGPDNMELCSDIMGGACRAIEATVGGIALFMNADAGDIDPTGEACAGMPDYAASPIYAKAVAQTRASIATSATASIATNTIVVDFGPTDLNYTLSRFNNCTSGGPLDICSFCEVLRCDFNAHLPDNWIEDKPRFTAVRFDIGDVKSIVVTMPGEPLLELGWWVRNDTQQLGYDVTLLAGYSNSHMGYFAPPDEYDIGGYESQLTFWGITTAEQVRQGAYKAAQQIS